MIDEQKCDGLDDTGWRYNAPIFEPCFDIEEVYPNGDRLPGIWITTPVKDDKGDTIGQNCVLLYPSAIPGLTTEDTYGEDALFYGGRYYDEAMGYTDPNDHDKRVGCLSVAVEAGETWYAKALASARAGMKRCEQEISL